jgi:hypothetical protein
MDSKGERATSTTMQLISCWTPRLALLRWTSARRRYRRGEAVGLWIALFINDDSIDRRMNHFGFTRVRYKDKRQYGWKASTPIEVLYESATSDHFPYMKIIDRPMLILYIPLRYWPPTQSKALPHQDSKGAGTKGFARVLLGSERLQCLCVSRKCGRSSTRGKGGSSHCFSTACLVAGSSESSM